MNKIFIKAKARRPLSRADNPHDFRGRGRQYGDGRNSYFNRVGGHLRLFHRRPSAVQFGRFGPISGLREEKSRHEKNIAMRRSRVPVPSNFEVTATALSIQAVTESNRSCVGNGIRCALISGGCRDPKKRQRAGGRARVQEATGSL
jgi:hypothetical protein